MATGRVSDEAPLNPFDGWKEYPLNLVRYDPISTNGPALQNRLRVVSPQLFGSDVNVKVFDLSEDQGILTCSHVIHRDAESLERALSKIEKPLKRIISIHQPTSISPLKISRELMLKVLTRYQVVPEFLEILCSFSPDHHSTESGHSNVAVIEADDGVQHTCYQFRYAEENNRSLSIPWSLRQTGVYHQRSHDADLWIILNPTNESVVERQLRCLANRPHSTAIKEIIEDPYRLHILIFESYLRNWRWYLQWLDEKFKKRYNPAYVFDLKHDNPMVVSFEAVQALRDLHDDVSALSAHFNGDLKIIEVLKRLKQGRKPGHAFELYVNLLHGYNESAAVLHKRVQNVIDLTAYALDTKSQEEAAALNQHILRLSNESLDVNATVKTITILSLLYLPGSFVGTIFGTNFFWYNNKDNHIEVGTDFWIYVVTWIGLTVATMLTYLYLRWPHHWTISGQTLRRLTGAREHRA